MESLKLSCSSEDVWLGASCCSLRGSIEEGGSCAERLETSAEDILYNGVGAVGIYARGALKGVHKAVEQSTICLSSR